MTPPIKLPAGGSRWSKVTCPRCQFKHEIHVMRLTLTCACGLYYVDIPPHTGWYPSREAFAAGAERIDA